MFTRKLGRSGIEVSGLGLGCWAIGGPLWRGDQPAGWGQVDDAESIRAVHRALELGVTFIDTADVYGGGHSEEVLGKALAGKRDKVIIATKFGNAFDQTKHITGADGSPAYVKQACEASLRRLKIDVIDLYQFHVGDYDPVKALATRDALEELVAAGKIRYYGWSTDDPARARIFAEGPHCVAIQQRLNIFEGNLETLAVCEKHNLASINRSPLAKGLLTGKFSADSAALPEDDVRHSWNFQSGDIAKQLKKLQELRDILTAGGRTLTQGALGWIWAKSGQTIPIPGFKTVQQIEENAGALRFGPLSKAQMKQIDALLGR